MGEREAEAGALDLRRDALFLDYDGTLVDLAPTPEAAHADPELVDLLDRLRTGLDGALAIVTGRPVADVDGFLAPLRLTVAGLHGLAMRLEDGREVAAPLPPELLDPARAAFEELVATTPGTRLEDKSLSLALHFRQAPDAAERVLAVAERLAEESGGELRLLRGKMVAELLPTGIDKGTAIAHLLDLPTFAGRRPVFAGDDVTDEAGFRAVNALSGLSLRVGALAGTAALRVMDDNRALRRWLAAALDGAGPA